MIREHHGEETAPTLEIQSTEQPAFEPAAHGGVARPGQPKFARGTLIDRYVLLEHVGAGAMGVVYGAYDPELDRKIALKFLKSHDRDYKARARLIREAQALARLAHPNVVTVYDVGTFGDEVFVAMEYVHGVTLRQWLTARRRDWRDIVAVFGAIGCGLAAAHDAGLVHRDLKPENIMIGVDDRVRVMDFGLARAAVGESREDLAAPPPDQPVELTRTGTLLGTPAYMAPEQWEGLEADARTDQFAFCVALWEALYGSRPFCGETPSALLLAITRGDITPPRDGRRAPPWLRRLLERGLAVDPAARWPSMTVLLAELTRDHQAPKRRLGVLFFGLLALAAAALAARRIDQRREAAEAARLESEERAARADEDRKKAESIARNQEIWRLSTIGAHERDALALALAALAPFAPGFDDAPQVVIDALAGAMQAMLPVATIPIQEQSPRAVELSDDGTLLAVQFAGEVELWSTDPVLQVASVPTGAVNHAFVRISPGNRYIVVRDDDSCTVHASDGGARTVQVPHCHDLVFARDDSRFFVLKAHTGPIDRHTFTLLFDAVSAYRPDDGRLLWSTPLAARGAALALDPGDGRLVLATDQLAPIFLAADTGAALSPLVWRDLPAWNESWASRRDPASLAVSPDGRYIALAHPSAAEGALVFDTRRQRVERLPHLARTVLFSADGRRLLTANNDDEHTMVFHAAADLDSGGWEQSQRIVGKLHDATRDDELLLVGTDIRLSETPNLRQSTPPISSVHGEHLSTSRGGTRFAIISSGVTLWESADPLEVGRWTPPLGQQVVRFDEREVSTRDADGVVRLHDRRGERPPLVLPEPDLPGERSFAWSVDGGIWREPAANSKNRGLIRFYDEWGRKRYSRGYLPGGGRQTVAPAARAARIAAANPDGSVDIIEPPESTPLCTIAGDGTRVREVRISSEGTYVGVLHDSGELAIWSTPWCKRELAAFPFTMPDQILTSLISFLGSELFVIRDDNRTSVLDPETGLERCLAIDTCPGAEARKGFSIISSDGRFLLTSCRSRDNLEEVRLWEVDSGSQLANIDFSAYSGVAYNPAPRSPGLEEAALLEFAHSGEFLVARTQKGQLAVLSVPALEEQLRLHTRSAADDFRLRSDDRFIDVLDAESGAIHTYPVTRAGLVEAACRALARTDIAGQVASECGQLSAAPVP
ncbi:Serine/threonine protein kinase [Nannocystis exedens]|uniref:Serine/threonine protein kinase n=1 Tax=Nannocystis exedens TaxID=54 RepID=A0A1I2IDB8_9BACT|nr:serine/threonine-protein kinase [Nannocystis exedens]PCC70100.1 serine/threonine protein kinase [Nannocystis exedens]SFF38846.1 Serine/threonine protein kinase [Nannocystis exedens]